MVRGVGAEEALLGSGGEALFVDDEEGEGSDLSQDSVFDLVDRLGFVEVVDLIDSGVFEDFVGFVKSIVWIVGFGSYDLVVDVIGFCMMVKVVEILCQFVSIRASVRDVSQTFSSTSVVQ